MGYQDSVIQKPKTTFLLLNKINFAFASISPAHAVWGLVASMAVDGAVWLASTQAIKLAGGFVMKKVLGRTAASVATKTAVEVESAVAATAAAKALEVGSKEAVVAAKDAVLKNLNIFKNAKEAVATAVKTKQNPAEVKRLSDLAVVA